jgi:hypothetical protein
MFFVSPAPHLAFIPLDRCLALAGAHDLPERTEGAVWTGAYGPSRRCTFGAVGRTVNLARG